MHISVFKCHSCFILAFDLQIHIYIYLCMYFCVCNQQNQYFPSQKFYLCLIVYQDGLFNCRVEYWNSCKVLSTPIWISHFDACVFDRWRERYVRKESRKSNKASKSYLVYGFWYKFFLLRQYSTRFSAHDLNWDHSVWNLRKIKKKKKKKNLRIIWRGFDSHRNVSGIFDNSHDIHVLQIFVERWRSTEQSCQWDRNKMQFFQYIFVGTISSIFTASCPSRPTASCVASFISSKNEASQEYHFARACPKSVIVEVSPLWKIESFVLNDDFYVMSVNPLMFFYIERILPYALWWCFPFILLDVICIP